MSEGAGLKVAPAGLPDSLDIGCERGGKDKFLGRAWVADGNQFPNAVNSMGYV